jgi:mono/diheme cytochrome c family protein
MKSLRLCAALGSLLCCGVIYAADAKTNWEEHCAKCHGGDGKGETKMGKKLSIRDLTDGKVQASFTDEDIVKSIKQGIKDKNGKLQMKPIEELTEDDAKAMVPFVRQLKA